MSSRPNTSRAILNTSVSEAQGLRVYFYSQRAKINSNPTTHLKDFINGANHSLLCAIYDLEHPDILKALQSAAGKLKTNLHIVYDAGKSKSRQAGVTADPKPTKTAELIKQYGLDQYASGVHVKGGNLMHDKFLVRDGKEVWTGSGNFTKGGLTLQDNNFLVIPSTGLASAYKDAFYGLLHPGHTLAHAPKKPKATAPASPGR